MDDFATKVVLPKLVDAGFYRLHPTVPTPEGERARDDLESRMAAILCEMRLQSGSWVGRKPRQTLMKAVMAVALGRRRLPEEPEPQLVGHQV